MGKQKTSRLARTRRRNAARRLTERQQTPFGRLSADGATSPSSINRRLLWLSSEWGLERAPKVGRTASEALSRYCKRHGISYDWMLCGDLKGLRAMMDGRRVRVTAANPDRLRARLACLTEAERALVSKVVDHLLPRG